tara:strand:- start:4212 stop:4403 length:192 start_codon:yes stop_codon:yes gene_type:complete
MPHKVVKKGKRYFVRSWVTGKLLKKSYATRKAAQNKANESYNRSKRVRHTKRKTKKKSNKWWY